MSLDAMELLALSDVVSFSLSEADEGFFQEMIEKSTRLLGLRRLALVIPDERGSKTLHWGFREPNRVAKSMNHIGENSFLYRFGGSGNGAVYLEKAEVMSERDKRLCTIFSRRVESIVEQKLAEQRIRRSEQEKDAILNSVMELLVFQDTNHRILWANTAALEHASAHGLTDMVGRRCHEVWHDRKTPCEGCLVVKAAESGQPQEGTVTNAEGRVWFVRGYPVMNERGEIDGVVKVSMDVSEKTRAEAALRASEETLRVTFDNVNDGIIIHDLDGRVIEVNDRICRMYGIDRHEALGLSIVDDYSSPSNPVDSLPNIWQRVAAGESHHFEWKAKRRDGSLFDVEVFLNRLCLGDRKLILATVRDVTSRKDEEEFLKNLFVHSPIGIYIAKDGRFEFVNSQFVAYTGYSREQLLTMGPLDLVVPEERDRVRDNAIKMLKGARSFPYEFCVQRNDAERRWVVESVTSIPYQGGVATLGNVMDTTERRQVEERLRFLSLHDQLTGLRNRACFEEELMRPRTAHEYPITILSADLDGLKLINDTMGHKAGDRLLGACADLLGSGLRETDILARVGGDEFAAILPRCDERTATKIVGRIRTRIERHNKKQPSLPLSVSIGVATAGSPMQFLNEIVKIADDLMYRDKLHRSASTRSRLVNTLLAALAAKDHIAEGHVRRVEILSRRLGMRLGLSSRQIADLCLLAQVHDLGKVGIPDYILQKAGPLTPEEWAIMHRHPEIGYRIANSCPDLSAVAKLILHHHEWWNGEGYPMGLKHEEIPVECRILSLADAFDAMTSGRPYSRAKSTHEALTEINRCSGIQFDPEMVKEFLQIAREGDLRVG